MSDGKDEFLKRSFFANTAKNLILAAMILITRAVETDSPLIADLGRQTFIESHGHSAAEPDINIFIERTYTDAILKTELSDPRNIYHITRYNDEPAGYSKIIFDYPYTGSDKSNITKLERIYILNRFYDLRIGSALFDFNMDLIKQRGQAGVWLYVWKENKRAFNFYVKKGFEIIGSYDYKISETHSNPNHRMLLSF